MDELKKGDEVMDVVGFEPTIIGTYACGLEISPIFL